MEIDFRVIEHGSVDWKKAVQLREEILRKPLGSVFSQEELEEEKKHYHIVGYSNNELIATAVLVPEGDSIKMQRVVVLNRLRNLNIGSKMMSFCEAYVLAKGYQTMYCHARDSAVNFYSRNNYQKLGDYFDEDGIPHLKMNKNIINHV